MMKKVKDITLSDKIMFDGVLITVLEITNGFYRGSKIITLSNGKWFCRLNNEKN